MAFLYFNITAEQEQKAQEIRKKRDEQYGNIYNEEDSDLRWVGDLGEICFNAWLKNNNIQEFSWHLNNAAGKPDFTIGTKRIDVKTVKRIVPPQKNYTAQITARHKDFPIDELFFCSYEYQKKRMWFLGGISKKEFLEKSIYYQEGDKVHNNYTIRRNHEIYNAEISILQEPTIWIKLFDSNTN